MTAKTDRELLGEFVRTHDSGPFEELVRRYGSFVHDVCSRLLANEHDADDATQAAFILLARKAASLAPDSVLAAWLRASR